MKKLILTVAVVSLLFSCGEEKFYLVSITNSSSKTVSYTYNDISETVDVSKTKSYEVRAYTQPPKNITDENGIASVTVKQDGMTGNYTFSDAIPLELNVINMLPVDVTIKAGNFIDNNGSMELTVESNKENTEAIIYTKTPKFVSTSEDDYPITAAFTIVDNKMSAVIR